LVQCLIQKLPVSDQVQRKSGLREVCSRNIGWRQPIREGPHVSRER
ncbi:hypothetical protein GBAR_LOCUS3518, partial [Geodia barretti]